MFLLQRIRQRASANPIAAMYLAGPRRLCRCNYKSGAEKLELRARLVWKPQKWHSDRSGQPSLLIAPKARMLDMLIEGYRQSIGRILLAVFGFYVLPASQHNLAMQSSRDLSSLSRTSKSTCSLSQHLPRLG